MSDAAPWLAPAIDAARARTTDQAARLGLAVLEQHAPSLEHLGRDLGRSFLQAVGAGDRELARGFYLAGPATFAERRAASAARTASTLEAAEARERAADELLAVLLQVGVQVAIPLLIAAL